MLQWISCHAKEDKRRNKNNREKEGVAPIVLKMVDTRLCKMV